MPPTRRTQAKPKAVRRSRVPSLLSRQKKLEKYIEGVISKEGPSMYIPWFLILSWSYYVMDISPVRDTWFDEVCHTMLREWKNITHRHKDRISEEDLRAGTGFAVTYPEIAKGAARKILVEYGHARLA
jgi:hypothetical protein